ncbi:MAG: hypothetical protein ACK5IP_20430 [Paracoccus sp. (in: a-proteobacteria)]
MNMEDVNNAGNGGGPVSAELADLDREFADLIADFDLDDGGDTPEMGALDAAIAGTEFASAGAERGSVSLLDIADGVMPESMSESQAEIFGKIGGIFKRRASRLIKKLIGIVRSAAKYKSCVPLVTAAVVAFKAGKWGTALRQALSAYRCIKSKS